MEPLSPPLSPDQIEADLGTTLIGRRIQFWNSVSSTNDLADRAAASRGNEGLVVLAEAQSAGRGRQGRTWLAPPRSSILMSVLLFPPPEIAQPESLVCLSAAAIAQALEEFASTAIEIKWPNDLLLAGRKLGGILVERRRGAVIGVGVNVHSAPPDQPGMAATALVQHARRPLDRSCIVRRLLQVLDARYAEALRQGVACAVRDWRRRAAYVGECVEVESRGGTLQGTLLDIDPLSHLALRTPFGLVCEVPLREVQVFRRAARE